MSEEFKIIILSELLKKKYRDTVYIKFGDLISKIIGSQAVENIQLYLSFSDLVREKYITRKIVHFENSPSEETDECCISDSGIDYLKELINQK